MSSPISAFTAVPNPQMLAFMGAQSFLMMQMAGAGWQYGKRKISAMKNEEFNPLTVNALLQKETADVRAAIPTIIKSINDMTPMVHDIVAQYGDFIREIIRATPQLVSNIYQPTEKPSVETFNPLSILNPLLPAFAEESSTSTTGHILSKGKSNNIANDLIRNINKTISLVSLRNIALSTYGMNSSDFNRVGAILIARMEKLNPSSSATGKPTGGAVGKVNRRWKGTSTQSLSIERNSLIRQIRTHKATLGDEKSFISSRQKLQFKTIKRDTLAKLGRAQQKLADILLELKRRR